MKIEHEKSGEYRNRVCKVSVQNCLSCCHIMFMLVDELFYTVR